MPRLVAKLAVALIVANVCRGDLLPAAEPELTAVFPLGCSRGGSVEVTLVGRGLDQAAVLHFTQPGLSFEHLEKDRFRISASEDAAIGSCDVWVATAEGLAGPRRFHVTAEPVTVEKEDNDHRGDAQPVTIPAIVDARLDKAADVDWFTFRGEQGQRIVIGCRSSSVDGSAQPVVTLVGSDGRELLHSSADRLDPQAEFTLPDAGDYHLLVHDRAYRKDDFSFYRLELHSPRTDLAESPRSRGFLAPESTAEVSYNAAGLSSPEMPQAVTLPCRIAGDFPRRGEVDWYQFTAEKDQTLHIEALGERLGILMDLDAAIYDGNDRQIVELKDMAAPKGLPGTVPLSSLDPMIDWKVPADGQYKLAIRDLYGGSVFGRHRRYELLIEPQQPRFYTFVMPGGSKPSRSLLIKRGTNAEAAVFVVRSGGFAEAVTVRLAQPIRGLALETCVVEPEETTKPCKLTVSADAALGFHALQLVAEADIGPGKVSAPVPQAAAIRPGWTRRVDNLMIYISE